MQKRKYKALVVDFDNTLVGRDFVVSEKLRQAVEKIRQNGVKFSIATGRPYFGRVREICRELALVEPQIGYGGGEIYDPRTDGVIWAQYISEQEVWELLDFFQKQNFYFLVQKKDSGYAKDCRRLRETRYDARGIKLKEIAELEAKDVPKIILVASVNKFSNEKVEEIVRELQRRFTDLYIVKIRTYDGYYGVDITSARASKHLAVLELMKLSKLKPEDVVGVGDGYNDYPLLTACGAKVAMGDAPRELKEIADFIAPPQGEDGLAEVIEKYFS